MMRRYPSLTPFHGRHVARNLYLVFKEPFRTPAAAHHAARAFEQIGIGGGGGSLNGERIFFCSWRNLSARRRLAVGDALSDGVPCAAMDRTARNTGCLPA